MVLPDPGLPGRRVPQLWSGLLLHHQVRLRRQPVVCYVDDFIAFAPESRAEFLWAALQEVVTQLGLAPSSTPGHLSPPNTVFTGLGVQFDLVNNTIALPPTKLASIIALVDKWSGKTEASLNELQQLLGSLHHCSKVVRSGRLFVSRMLDTLRRAMCVGNVPLDSAFRLDLEWWAEALRNWNGVSFLEFSDYGNRIALDASTGGFSEGRPGIGGFNFKTNEYFKLEVPPALRSWHICDLELVAHLVCCHLWGATFRGCKIYGLTDSEPAEWFIRNGCSRIDRRLRIGRTLNHMEHRLGFLWYPAGIRSAQNVLPDCLSRWASAERRATFAAYLKQFNIVNPIERDVFPFMLDPDFRFCPQPG